MEIERPRVRSKATGAEMPLHVAAAYGTAETINASLKAGADINARGKLGATPLHIAAVKGTPETINALLKAGGRHKGEGR